MISSTTIRLRWNYLLLFTVALALVCTIASQIVAQESTSSLSEGVEQTAPTQDYRKKLQSLIDEPMPVDSEATESSRDNGAPGPQAQKGVEWDENTVERYQQAERAGQDYRIRGYDHRSRVFSWQLFSSKLIFFVVVLLVAGGMYFAWVQFHIGLRAQRDSGEKPEPTKLSASLKGVEVTSPILGVIILMISLLFFYLYLAHVYPIREVF